MMITFLRSQRKLVTTGMGFCFSLALLTGCNGPDDTATKSPVKSPEAKESTKTLQDFGLTLPVLNALFYEDGFEAALKSKLQLTDEQVAKLKEASSASTADLTEDGADYLGSARVAKEYSDQQIRSIIGAEKANQLQQFVAARYSNGDIDGLFPTQPNSIPKDTRIVVNAAAFRMDVFQEGKLLKTYKIGIGYPEFPLPTGMRRAENIIFNPTWTPPDEPWVKGKVQAGKKVAAGSKLNPLGPIKIPIGLPSLIHGGKALSKLGNFASHGCVGLTNGQVQDFTAVIAQLSGEPISADSILNFEKNKTKTKTVKLNKAIPVELRYETLVVENGNLYVYRDVYERGTNTMENVNRVLAVYGLKYESLNEQEKANLKQALDEMNRDAHGNAITSTAKDSADEKESSSKGKVTKAVVGKKEIIVPISALQGKGYPMPANYNEGKTGTVVIK